MPRTYLITNVDRSLLLPSNYIDFLNRFVNVHAIINYSFIFRYDCAEYCCAIVILRNTFIRAFQTKNALPVYVYIYTPNHSESNHLNVASNLGNNQISTRTVIRFTSVMISGRIDRREEHFQRTSFHIRKSQRMSIDCTWIQIKHANNRKVKQSK